MTKNSEYMAVGLTDRSDTTTTPLDGESTERQSGERKAYIKNQLQAAVYSFVPILYWLPRYKWKDWLIGDLIAGLTVGIMHVPQGMAYASLASVPPVVGMYSSFFASFVYMFFGTSRHISIGVFAVASMMVGACRLRLVPHIDDYGNALNGTAVGPLMDVSPLQLTSALSLAVGLVQILMGAFRLGFLTTYLSDPLVSGFTTGSAAHVFMSQLNKVFGVKLPRHEGVGMLLKMLYDIIRSLPQTNLAALLISVFGILFLSVGRDYVNPIVKRYSKVPLPLELILVILGVVVSWFLALRSDYGVSIVNTIPRGFPAPSVPRFDLVPVLLSDAVPIAVVCYMFVMSMGKLFAKKHKYKTDATQELYAVGLMSSLSSAFPVYPVGASLSRSAVCEMSGANTMLYVVFSSSLLLTVILFVGPFLEPLPMCILACIVIVSLKSLFMQAKQLPYLWKVSRYDFAIWLVSCLATVLTDVTKGLIISVLFAILTIVLREQWPSYSVHSPSAASASPPCPEDVRVFRFQSPLHFANVATFSDAVAQITNADKENSLLSVSALVVDCSSIAYTDSMGLDAFRDAYLDGKKSGVKVFFAGLNEEIESVLKTVDFYSKVPSDVFCVSVGSALGKIANANQLVN